MSSDGKSLISAYDTKGLSITYIAAPKITGITNISTGVKITWGKVTGAEKYRVFRKTGNESWTRVGDTTALTFTDKTAKTGTTYVYTVRCITSDGKEFTSMYDTTGKTIFVYS